MYTGSFSKQGSKPNAVSIARTVPRVYMGKKCEILAPKFSLLDAYKAGQITEEEYTNIYNNTVLEPLKDKIKELYYETLGEDSILLCWEKYTEFCHRRLVAKWFETNLGVVIPEIR